MAQYDVQLLTPIKFFVGDKPDIEGKIIKNSIDSSGIATNLAGVTVRWQKGVGYVYSESVATYTSSSGTFIWSASTKLSAEDTGHILIGALVDSGVAGTIDSTISSGDSSVAVTLTAGSLPDEGWVLIDSEWCEFTNSSGTLTLTRSQFGTTAASHTSGAAITVAAIKETCNPPYEFRVLADRNA